MKLIRILETWNIQSFKWPTRSTESNSQSKIYTMFIRALPEKFLDSARLGIVITFLESLIQCSPCDKNLCLISSLRTPLHSILLFPQVLPLATREKRSVPAPPPFLIRGQQTMMKSPPILDKNPMRILVEVKIIYRLPSWLM